MTASALAADIRAGTATLCWCLRVVRRDGTALGFTDHDADVSVGAVTFAASSAISPAQLETRLGGGMDFSDVIGALSSESITETDLRLGRYDGAEFALWRINHADPSHRMLCARGRLGPVEYGGPAWRAEVASLSSLLTQPTARVNTQFCDADLGDARCGVDLDAGGFRVSGTVTAVESAGAFTVAAAAAKADGFFVNGEARFTTGALALLDYEVRASTGGAVTLYDPPAVAPSVGDAVTLTAGCDKTLATCKARFANTVNFRGNPFATPEAAQAVPSSGAEHDGGSRFT